ncbi:MAG: hypothetical protein A3B38_03965 [Candidatus Levybacteria bacterium RIFCSPLOWO2_01_FULL_36_13]|nr:MAG: hypothetical protein A2684_00900 [Candidatus Levybacteria bacterium RIFCSPHIGHO2_01_FULL_36_15b]OGH34284.1 MAG: hypothetical protein A3B38_03965 [Candidatus Levybacteria bacterium RIFCSPLOWO2_01_FULL_36_13]
MFYIVANFKSYKTQVDAENWLEKFKSLKIEEDKKVIVCPPFTLLPLFKSFIKENSLQLLLGSQNISPFDEGPYTGEENAKQIKEFADYVLIGHSERRVNFKEDDNVLDKKCEVALKNGLVPIFLVQSEKDNIPKGVEIIAYEPVFAIGSGIPDTPDNASAIASVIKKKGDYRVLYGGSVNSENVKEFSRVDNISGVLVGGASLEADEFIKVIKNA